MTSRFDTIVEIEELDPGHVDGSISIRMESGSEILLSVEKEKRFKVGDKVRIVLTRRRQGGK